MIKQLWLKISNNTLLKKVIEYFCFAGFGIYVFSIGAFSGRTFFNYFSIAIGLLMIFLMIFYVLFYGKIKIDLFLILLVNFSFSFLLSNLINLSFSSFPKSVFTQSLMSFVMYQFFVNIDKEKLKLIFPIVVVAGFAFFLFYFIHYRSEIISFNFGNRLGSYFDNENEIAKEFGYLGVTAFCCGVYTRKSFEKTPKFVFVMLKAFYFFTWFLFLFAVLTTGSISNLLTLLFVTFLVALIRIKKSKHKIIFVATIFVSIGAFFLILQLPSLSYFNKRLLSIFNTFTSGDGGDASSSLRLYALVQYIQLFFLRPLFGFGYGQGKMYTAYYMVAHSSIAELLTCTGLFGFVSFELILILSLLSTRKKRQEYAISFVLLYVIIFQLFISSIYHAKFEYIFISIAFAICSDSFSFDAIKNKFKVFINCHSFWPPSKKCVEINI